MQELCYHMSCSYYYLSILVQLRPQEVALSHQSIFLNITLHTSKDRNNEKV